MHQSNDLGWLNGFKKDVYTWCLQETNFQLKDTQTEYKGMEKHI